MEQRLRNSYKELFFFSSNLPQGTGKEKQLTITLPECKAEHGKVYSAGF